MKNLRRKNLALNLMSRSFFVKNDFFLKIEDRNVFVKRE
jgi:hypothetical protein